MHTYENPVRVDFVRGDYTGLEIPAHSDALCGAAGASFLTEAFHHFGSLPADNRVVRITRAESFPGGNSGHKLAFSVEYAHHASDLHRDLFVKFSRDFSDPFRDRRRNELEAEVRLATLSRHPQFPVHVPKAYFADFQHASDTGLLITQQIAFGQGAIEPLHRKCMDHLLPEPLTYYRAILTALADLAAAYKAGRLSPQVEQLFPFDLETAVAADPIAYDEPQLRERTERYRAFGTAHPQLLPANVTTPEFVDRLGREAVRFLRHERTIKRFLHADRDYIALCHYNGNIDNAWFWRDARGGLQCGLLDWGRVRPMNVAYSIWGSLCAGDLQLWDLHLDELIQLFVDELHRQGGPLLQVAEIKLHLHLYVATMGLATMIDVPRLILTRVPHVGGASGPRDPILERDTVARGFLQVFSAFLNLWQSQDFGASLDCMLQRLGLPDDAH
jgi:hypothetical protein